MTQLLSTYLHIKNGAPRLKVVKFSTQGRNTEGKVSHSKKFSNSDISIHQQNPSHQSSTVNEGTRVVF